MKRKKFGQETLLPKVIMLMFKRCVALIMLGANGNANDERGRRQWISWIQKRLKRL